MVTFVVGSIFLIIFVGLWMIWEIAEDIQIKKQQVLEHSLPKNDMSLNSFYHRKSS